MSGVRTDDEPNDLPRKPGSGSRSSWAIALCVALISLVGAVIVMRWHTRVPVFDQWTLLNFYDAWHAGTATWRDWWAPHNGLHLSVLPRFVLGGVALLSGWNLAATSAVSVVLVVVAMAALAALTPTDADRTPLSTLAARITIALVMFSPALSWPLLWQIGVYHHLINVFWALAVFALCWGGVDRAGLRVGVAFLACALASFTRIEGLITWWCLLPAVVVLGRELGRITMFVSCWLLGAAGSVVVTLLSIQNLGPKPGAARIASGLNLLDGSRWIDAVEGGMALLGQVPGQAPAQLLGYPLTLGRFVLPGVLTTLVFLGLAGVGLRAHGLRGDRLFWSAFGTGAYALCFSVATALARGGLLASPFGPGYNSMYATTSALLTVASLQLSVAVLRLGRSRSSEVANARWGGMARSGRLAACWMGGLLVALLVSWAIGWPDAIAWRKGAPGIGGRRDCFEVAAFLRRRNTCFTVTPGPVTLAMAARIGAPEARRDLSRVPEPGAEVGQVLGWKRLAPQRGEQRLAVEGRLERDSSAGRTPLVLLVLQDDAAFSGHAQRVQRDGSGWTWRADLPAAILRARESRVEAWLYDAEAAAFFALEGHVVLPSAAAWQDGRDESS